MSARTEYYNLRDCKRQLYYYSILLDEAEESTYVYEVTLDYYCKAVDSFFKQYRKVHKMDWDDLSNRNIKYLKTLKYAFDNAVDRNNVLRQFKCII